MNKAQLNLGTTRSHTTPNPNETRIAMRSFWKLTLVLAFGGLLLAAPLTAFAAAPDMYVVIGSIVPRPPDGLPLRWYLEVYVTVGNLGNVQPNASVSTFFWAGTASGPVCPALGLADIQGNLTPGAAIKAFRFRVAYLSNPNPQHLAKLPKGVVQYTLRAEVKYINYECSQGVNETYCANNQQSVTLTFPAGGTPSCAKLVQ